MADKPKDLTYAGLKENIFGEVMAMMVGEGVEWMFNISGLETRAVNRMRLKLSTVEEEKALAALMVHQKA